MFCKSVKVTPLVNCCCFSFSLSLGFPWLFLCQFSKYILYIHILLLWFRRTRISLLKKKNKNNTRNKKIKLFCELFMARWVLLRSWERPWYTHIPLYPPPHNPQLLGLDSLLFFSFWLNEDKNAFLSFISFYDGALKQRAALVRNPKVLLASCLSEESFCSALLLIWNTFI